MPVWLVYYYPEFSEDGIQLIGIWPYPERPMAVEKATAWCKLYERDYSKVQFKHTFIGHVLMDSCL